MRADRRPLAALLAAQGVSVTGNRIAQLAIPWFVLQTTGSAASTGMAVAVNTVPAIVAGLLAGPWIERLGYRTTSIAADVASGATIAAIPALYVTGHLSYPLLLVLVFLGALLDAPGDTARRSLLPDLADHGGVSIDRATSLHETTFRTTQLLGAPAGGLLIAAVGATTALGVDAVTFTVSAVLVALLTPKAAAPATAAPGGYFDDLRAAWRLLLGHRLLRSTVAMFIGANILETALVLVLLPVMADRVYQQPVALGLLVGGVGAGALIGVAIHTAIADRYPRRVILLPALILAGPPKFLLLAAFPPAWVAIAGTLLFAIAMGPVNPIAGAIEYGLIPRHMRARVFGLLGVAFTGAAPVGALAAGTLAETIGLRTTLIAAAIAYLPVVLVPVFHPAWQDLDNLTPAATP